MALTADDVARLAGLARLHLSESECAELAPELDIIFSSVEQVARVAQADIPMMTHALPMTNVMRDDLVTPSLTPDQALSVAPSTEDGRFRVHQILGEEA